MALIGKIRKNFWIVLILLAMALASFIIMDVMGSRRGGGMFGQPSNIGEIAGQKIDYREFEKTERILYGGSNDVYGRRQMLWNYLIEKAFVDKMASQLGLGVSKDELMDLQFGANLSPIVRNNFSDPRTGQVNMQSLLQFKQAFESGQDMNPEFRDFWGEQEKQVVKQAIQDKINNLVSKAMIIPKWQLETMNALNNDKIAFDYVKVGFDKIPDTELKLTDDDFKAFLAKNPGKYTNQEETRILEYVTFSVTPSKQDSIDFASKLSGLVGQFRTATNDSLFTASNGGSISPVYQKLSEITGPLADSVKRMGIGSVVGPYFFNGSYVISKLVDRRVVPDSVKARHILRSTSPTARKEIDSLKNLIVTGRAKFDSLARKNSQDPGSGMQGGDLGTFAQGQMVKPFNDACFVTGKPGGLYVVESQFGVHLIEVLNQKYVDKSPKYLFANINSLILPKEETSAKVYDKVSAIVNKVKNLNDLKSIAEKDPSVVIQTSRGLRANDYNIPGLTGAETSRSIIKWAYEADENDFSKTIYTYQDPVNLNVSNYVIAGLKSINKPGVISIAEAKNNLEALVKNYKKGELLKAKITSSDLNAIASQFGTTIDTANNVTFTGGIIGNGISEPNVVAKLFGLEKGAVSKPIVGNTGVYVAKIKEKTPVTPETSNFDMVKQSLLSSARQTSPYRIWDALKKKFKPKDNRSSFY